MSMRQRLITLLAAIAAVAIAGCGLSNPYQTHGNRRPAIAPSTTTAPADTPDPPQERGGTIPQSAGAAQAKLAAGAARSKPRAALERYGTTYVNWDAAHVIAIQHELAAISLGQARALAQQAAASAAGDPELTQSHVANHGQVISIAPGQGPAAGQWVIVTSEVTSGQGQYAGLPPTLHIIYAKLTKASQGWVVSGWQPQN
jgi:hypothetical protein